MNERKRLIIEAVKNGTPIPEPINQSERDLVDLAEAINESKELPKVTPADSGKVAAVGNDGKWSAETPSGGGGFLVIKGVGTITENDGLWLAADKTFDDVVNAAENFIPVFVAFPQYTIDDVPSYSYDNGYNIMVQVSPIFPNDGQMAYFKKGSIEYFLYEDEGELALFCLPK